jgi:hypothetical protein
MRLSLIDLLVLTFLSAVGLFVGLSVFHFSQLADSPFVLAFMLLGWLIVVLPGASLIYRRFHFRPLFLPRCPHCHKRPDRYEISKSGWPREVIVCALCRGTSELWYAPRAGPAETSSAIPSLSLRWPYFIGLYRGTR